MICIHMRLADRFFARMDFGTPYWGDFFCTEYTYTRTHEAIQSNVYIKYAEIDFSKYLPIVMKTQTAFRNKKYTHFPRFSGHTLLRISGVIPPGSRACDFSNQEILS